MRIPILFALLCATAPGQTAAVSAVKVTIQPPPITISVPCAQQVAPKNGGKVTLAMCPNTITQQPITVTIPAQTAHVTINTTLNCTQSATGWACSPVKP